jgi:hypothetical protein
VSEYAEEERDLQIAQIAGVNPNIHLQTEPEPGAISPPVVLPGAPGEVELNPFEEQIPEEGLEGEEEDEDYYSDESESDIDLGGEPEPNNFAVLHTSLPGHTESPSGVPGQLRPLLGMPQLSSSSSSNKRVGRRQPLSRRERAKCDGISVLGVEARLWRSCWRFMRRSLRWDSSGERRKVFGV